MLISRRKLQLAEPAREAMRRAGRFNAELMDFVREHVRAGITTEQIDKLVHNYTLDHGHTPAPLNYRGFPKSCCTSVNEVICHGIPDCYELKPGDIVNVDLTSIVDGWHGDQSETFMIEDVSDDARNVIQCAFDCLHLAIAAIGPGSPIFDIGDAIENEAAKYGFGVVEEFVGHGLGRQFHQDPSIPHCRTDQGRRDKLQPGMCFTIEPMINVGRRETETDRRDSWTVRTVDRSLSAQFEHTILMTEEGPELLTLTEGGPQKGHRF